MTNKEVINFLNQVRKILLDDKSWLESTIQPINEAFDMAINALTAQPEETHDKRTEMHACDCISRQAAIARAVPLNLFGREVMIVSVSELENLPSAQPSSSCAHENDSINRRAAIDAADDMVEPQESEDKE